MGILTATMSAIIGIIALSYTFQGLATATLVQHNLKQKTEIVVNSQSINNVLQNVTACNLSVGKQSIYYSNGLVAYTAGTPNNVIASFAWSTQGAATVLTIQPTNTMFKPIVLNLNCNVVATPVPTASATSVPTGVATSVPTTNGTGLDNGNHTGEITNKPCNN